MLVDLGGQTVTLFHLGPGHTDGDLLVGTPTTLFVGDLVDRGPDTPGVLRLTLNADWSAVTAHAALVEGAPLSEPTTGFVEAASNLLLAAGHDPRRIRTERFGGA